MEQKDQPTVTIPVADLKRIQLYVDDAALGEYSYVEPEGKLCSDLIDGALKRPAQVSEREQVAVEALEAYEAAFDACGAGSGPEIEAAQVALERRFDELRRKALAVPPAYPGANHGHAPETVRRALAQVGEDAKRAAEGLNALAEAMSVGDIELQPDGTLKLKDGLSTLTVAPGVGIGRPEDPIGELSAVIWFLATLVLDHEPGCAIKQADGSACDCDKVIPDGDPWDRRIKRALGLPKVIREQVAGLAKKLETRRVVQAKRSTGKEGPGGVEMHEFPIKDGIQRLVVLRLPEETLKDTARMSTLNLEMAMLKQKLGGQTTVFALTESWEFMVLELPR